ncbi:unnamed protein product [Linum trigynum]|uniref:F-box domain-containing protein n=1 Tax=Linum trigynum TaxID=586398 RepID=A0AAV2EYX1_9ROSI
MQIIKEISADVQIDILGRLPLASCIVRFRCVSKQWCALISDPSFTRHKLFSAAENPDYSTYPLTMIVKNNKCAASLLYTLHSRNTLEPLLEAESPFDSDNYRIVGYCNGLMCMGYHGCSRDPTQATALILWNPATSEIKVLPPTLYGESAGWVRIVGLGFDPESNDYKVVRQIIDYGKVGMIYDQACWDHHFEEVYSLSNDSWKRIDVGVGQPSSERSFLPQLPDYEVPRFCKGKLYWWTEITYPRGETGQTTRFASFDLSREVFEIVDVAKPAAAAEVWRVRSLLELPPSQLGDHSLAAVCCSTGADDQSGSCFEIWALLKLWVPESWTKLFVVPIVTDYYRFWGSSTSFLFFYDARDSNWLGGHDWYLDPEFIARRLQTGETVALNSWDVRAFLVVNYVPSRVSLIHYR